MRSKISYSKLRIWVWKSMGFWNQNVVSSLINILNILPVKFKISIDVALTHSCVTRRQFWVSRHWTMVFCTTAFRMLFFFLCRLNVRIASVRLCFMMSRWPAAWPSAEARCFFILQKNCSASGGSNITSDSIRSIIKHIILIFVFFSLSLKGFFS